jgi:hypothetical protein
MVRRNVRSDGECWVAKWIFHFAHLQQGPSGAEVAAAYDVAVTNPPRRMKVSGPTCRSATSVGELKNMTSE